MSSNVDERVVKLSFDNKKFEENVNQSISTLDKFNDQLRFDNVSDGTARVEASFSAMEVAIFTVINRITNGIIDLGVQLVKSLSVDNITTGWVKFGQKTTSVATLAAQNIKIAGKSIDDYTQRMDVVNEQLQKLNWFTDETSYNFTDMVDNIGKFTAAGRDLDESVKAMEGIATWASLSGQNAATASRAMYQLAQALGKGNIQLIDWRSIQNANMDTQEFRQTVLDTAVSIGQLTKEGENYITKAGTKFNINQFTEQLSSKWFTSDVLIKSLDKYSSAVEQVYEIAQREGITASEVMEKYGDQLDVFGLKAFRSAQEAKTLADAMNSVKDAVSTGWMNTAEKIFGGYDESKVLWSELADQLYNVFAEGGNFRNQVLGLWKDLGGRANLFGEHGSSNQGAFWNIYDAIIAVKDLITETWNSIFSDNQFTSADDKAKAAAASFKQLTTNLQAFTKRVKDTIANSTQLRMILTGIFSVIKLGVYTLQAIRYAIDPIIDAAKDLAKNLFNKVAAFTANLNKVEKITGAINKVATAVHDTLSSLVEIINPTGILESFLTFLGNLKDAFIQLDLVGTVENVFSSFFEGLKTGGGTVENAQRIIKGLSSVLSIIGKTLVSVAGILGKYILPVISNILDILSTIVGFVSGLLVSLLAIVGDFFSSLDDVIKNGGTSITTVGGKILDFVKTLPDKLQKLTPIIASLGRVITALIDIIVLIPKALDNISKRLTGKGIIENISSLFDTIAKTVENFRDQMASGDSSKVSNGLLGALGGFINSLINVLGSLVKVLTPLINLASKALDLLATLFVKIADGFNYILSLIDGAPISSVVVKTLAIVGGIVALIAALSLIYNIVYTCTAFTKKISYAITVMSDGVEEFLASFKFKAIAEMIESIGTMLLSFAISFAIIASLPINGIIKASAVIGSFILIISSLAITLVVLTKAMTPLKTSVTLFDKKNKKFLRSNGARSIFSSMAEFINSISKAMLRLAIAAAIMTNLDTTKLWNATGVLVVFMTAITIMLSVLQVISNKATKGNKNLLAAAKSEQRLGKSLKVMAGALVFVALAMKVMSKIDIGLLWNAVGIITVVFIVFTSFMIAIGKFANLGADKTLIKANKNGLTLTKQTQTMVKVLNALSKMLLALSVSLLIITTINDYTKIWDAVGVIATILVAYMAVVVAMEKFQKTRFKNYSGLAKTLNAFNASLLSIAVSVGILSLINIVNIWQAMSPILGLLAAYTVCVIAMEKFNNSASHAPFDTIAKTLNAMSLSMLSITVAVGFLSLIKDPAKIAQGVISIIAVLGAMTLMVKYLNKMATNSNDNSKEIVKMMKGISATLLSISLIMLIMSNMQITQMIAITGSIVALFLALSVLLTAMNKISGSKEKTKAIISMLSLLALNLVAFGGSMMMLFKTPWQTILTACLGLSAVLVAFSGSVMLISKSKNLKGNAFKMVAILSVLALNLVAFGGSMMMLAKTPWQSILSGCGGLSLVLLSFSGSILIISKSKNLKGNAFKMVALLSVLAVNLVAFGGSMMMLARTPWPTILTACLGLSAVLLAFSGSILIISKSKNLEDNAFKMVAILSVLALNLVAFGASMMLIARTPWQNILTACLGLSTVLLAFSSSVMLISKSKNLKGNAFKMVALLSVLAVNLVAFGASMMLMANVPWQNILTACLGLSAVLLALSAATLLMSSGSFKDVATLAAGMTLMGLSLVALSFGLMSLQTVAWSTIAKGAVVLAGSLAILGTVSKLLSGVGPVMLSISAAVMILGGGMLMAAVALQMFSTGLGSFAESMVSNVEVIGEALNTIGPVLIEAMINGFRSLLENITSILPTISTFVIELVNNILDVLNNTVPQIISTLANIFVSLLQTIADNTQPILESIGTIISSVMTYLLSKTSQIIKFLVDFIIMAIEGLTASMPKFIKTLTKFVIAFINAFFDNIGKVVMVLLNRMIEFFQLIIPKIVELLLDFVKTMGNAIIALVSGALIVAINLLGTLGSLALDFLAGLILLLVHISVGLGNVLFEAFRTLMYNVFKVLNKVLQSIAEDIPTLLGAGVKALIGGIFTLIGNLLNQFAYGLFGLGDLLKGWGADMAKQADDAFDKDILSGKNVTNALDEARSNIHNTMGNITGRISEDARNGVSDINKAITDSIGLVKNEQESNMKDAGYNVGEGFNEGVKDSYSSAYSAGSGLGDSASNGVRDSLDIHSPSRVMASIGRFLVQGFANGVTDNASVAENSITSMMNLAISGIQDAINGDQNTDIVIRPVMDLSNVRAGTQDISSIMSNINGSSARVSVSGSLASGIQSSINRKSLRDSEIQNGQTINNAGDTYNPVFNITSNNPNEVANEVNIRLQKMRAQAALAKGGAR